MRPVVILLLVAVLSTGCTDDQLSLSGPTPSADATRSRSVDPPSPATSEQDVLERLRRAVESARAGEPIPAATAPSVLELKRDYSTGGPDCPAFYRNSGRWHLCARGDVEGDRTMVVIGDSHARQWGSPLDVIAERAGHAAYHLVRLGCPAADVTPWRNKGDGPNMVCEQFHAWTEEQVRALRPEIVVLATAFNPHGYAVDGAQVLDETERLHVLREGMARLVERLAPYAGRVVVIGDPPAVPSPLKCLLRPGNTLRDCAAPGGVLSWEAIEAVRGAAADAGAAYVSTAEWFCLDNYCPTVLGELLSYRDQNHVSDTYARYLTEVLGQRLELGERP